MITLTTFQIITLVLSSSVIAAILAIFGNWIIQKNNYRQDYYKKVLDKRLNAYRLVEKIIGELTKIVHVDGKACPLICFNGLSNFHAFVRKFNKSSSHSFWLSDSINGKLIKLNIFLIQEIEYEINPIKNENAELVRLGIANRDKLQSFRKELESSLYEDFAQLHKIKKFIKNIRLPNSYPLQKKTGPL